MKNRTEKNKWNIIRRDLLSVMLVLILASCNTFGPKKFTKCETKSFIETPGKPSSIGRAGDIFRVNKIPPVLPADKAIMATFLFKEDGQVELNEKKKEVIKVKYGRGKTPLSDGCEFWFQLVDDQGNELAIYGIWDPRKLLTDEGEKRGFVEVPEATQVAIFPISPKAMEIRVLNAQRKKIATTNIGPIIMNFCAEHKDDQDCQQLNIKGEEIKQTK